MSIATKWKFTGSKMYVSTGITGVSPTPSISAISLTDPVIITAAAHGFVQGDVAKPSGILGATQFNNRIFPVSSVTTNDLAFAAYDNTNGQAYTSGGVLNKLAFTRDCQLTGIAKAGAGADQIDATTVCDEDGKVFVQGLADTGTLTLDYLYDPTGAVMQAIEAAEASGDEIAFKLQERTSAWTIILLGTVQSTNWGASVGDVLYKGSANVKLSGAPYRY